MYQTSPINGMSPFKVWDSRSKNKKGVQSTTEPPSMKSSVVDGTIDQRHTVPLRKPSDDTFIGEGQINTANLDNSELARETAGASELLIENPKEENVLFTSQ